MILLQIPYTLSLVFWLFSEPSSVLVSLVSCGSQNWVCFSKCGWICFGCRVNDVVEGAEKGTHCASEGSRAALAPSFLLFFLVTPTTILFAAFSIFLYAPRSTIAPSSQHWEFNDYLPQAQMFFNVTKSRITSLRMIFIFWFHIYTTKSSFTTLTFLLSSYTHGLISDLLFSLFFLSIPQPNKNILMMILFYCKLLTEALNSTRKLRSKNHAVPCIRNTFVQMWISICNYILH